MIFFRRKKKLKGKAFIYGAWGPKPLSNIPADAIKVRLRLRNNDAARAFVKFADRIEHWILAPTDEKTQACPTWKLGFLQGVNQPKPFLSPPSPSDHLKESAPE
jgi:hypothetical protein